MIGQVADVPFSLTGPDGQRPASFLLDNVTFEQTNSGFTHHWTSDPSPLTVTQGNAQAPTFRFWSYDRNFLTEGQWSGNLRVIRPGQAALIANMRLTLDEATATSLSTNLNNWWWLRRDSTFITTEDAVTDADCYSNPNLR